MPLTGKGLKPKNLGTVTMTAGWPVAKTVRMYKANKKRIIFGAPWRVETIRLHSSATPARNGDQRSPGRLRRCLEPARLRRYKACRLADTTSAFPLCLEGEHRVCRKPRSDFQTRPPRGRDQFPSKLPAPGLLFSQWRLILAMGED